MVTGVTTALSQTQTRDSKQWPPVPAPILPPKSGARTWACELCMFKTRCLRSLGDQPSHSQVCSLRMLLSFCRASAGSVSHQWHHRVCRPPCSLGWSSSLRPQSASAWGGRSPSPATGGRRKDERVLRAYRVGDLTLRQAAAQTSAQGSS